MPITHITPPELAEMLAQNPHLQLVDVRTPEEYYCLGHIPQARLIPLYELPYAFRALDAKEPVVVTCQHGVRSMDACYFLESQGFDTLYNLQEGMSTWPGEVIRDVSRLEKMMNPQPQGES